jgi:hypothetical protein
MPMPPEHYPPGWNTFSRQIRYARAKGRCECTGQCGMHRPNPATHRCVELNHKPARWARGRVVLTVAHLCTCDPICMNPAHVIAACGRCHLRIDRYRHAANRLATHKAHRTRNTDRGDAPDNPLAHLISPELWFQPRPT